MGAAFANLGLLPIADKLHLKLAARRSTARSQRRHLMIRAPHSPTARALTMLLAYLP